MSYMRHTEAKLLQEYLNKFFDKRDQAIKFYADDDSDNCYLAYIDYLKDDPYAPFCPKPSRNMRYIIPNTKFQDMDFPEKFSYLIDLTEKLMKETPQYTALCGEYHV